MYPTTHRPVESTASYFAGRSKEPVPKFRSKHLPKKAVSYFYDLNDQSQKPVQYTWFKLIPPRTSSILPISTKLIHASCKRSSLLTDRAIKLSWKQIEIRKRIILFRHRCNQRTIQLRAEMEYKQSLAHLRRQNYLWKRVERSASAVEKAATICNLRKLQKAQAIGRQNARNTVKKLNQSSEVVACSIKHDRTRSKAPINLKHLMPPITRFTLRELDVTEIYSSMQLRHDLIFDSDLQFRPNLDGEKGTVKSIRATQYWNAIQEEILLVTNRQGVYVRVPVLIEEIKEIIREMFPDASDVEETLSLWDVDKIVDSLYEDMGCGVPYMLLLAKLMHTYCAPSRDEMIDDMVALYQARFHVDALTKCLCILEHMRLDFANHNLRKLRPLIIANASAFEWRYFSQQFESGILSITHTKQWLTKAHLRFKQTGLDKTKFYPFAYMHLITNVDLHDACLPETMKFDGQRVKQLCEDYQDLSIMLAIQLLFRQFSGPMTTQDHARTFKRITWILLNDTDTSMDNICLQIAKDAAIIRQRDLSKTEKDLINRLVDATISADSHVFRLVQKHLNEQLSHYMAHGRLNQKLLRQSAQMDLEQELTDLGSKMEKLMRHNQKTFEPLYTRICRSLR